MRPVQYTVEGEAEGAPVVVDQYISPLNVGVQVSVDGVADYTVQYTLDDVFAPDWDPDTANWSPTDLENEVAAGVTVLTAPFTALRLINNAGTTGSTILRVVQNGLGL
jgi:hypothetical protein